jgi:hypothetical protein
MAALDNFDLSVIDRINTRLQEKHKSLEFFYEFTGWRTIGIRRISNPSEPLSTIELREPDEGNVRIENSLTKSDSYGKHFNTSLRYLSAMIAIKEGCSLESLAQSPISLYSMTKMFNCKIKIFNSDDEFIPIKMGSLTMEMCQTMIPMDPEEEYHIIAEVPVTEYDRYEKLVVDVITGQTIGGRRKRTKRFKNRRRTSRLLSSY